MAGRRRAPPKLRKGIDKILSKHDIETIAPGYGCILRGKKTVEKHITLVDDVLKSLDKSVATSRYVGRDEEQWPRVIKAPSTAPTRCRARSPPASSGWGNAWSSESRAKSITAATPAS